MSAIIPLANAYPSPVMSVPELLVMIVVIVGSLAAWLSLVFYAARQPYRERAKREEAPARSAGQASGEGHPAGRKAA